MIANERRWKMMLTPDWREIRKSLKEDKSLDWTKNQSLSTSPLFFYYQRTFTLSNPAQAETFYILLLKPLEDSTLQEVARLYLSMDVEKGRISSGYAKPPWIFKGSALYQIHLVKAATARAFIPKELRLVEAFGYTLGGFFLASYDDSPAGVFDELVVIAGIVWNPPTSCAWAARVLVNSDEACHHGRKEVGLPSQVARFSKKLTAVPKRKRDRAFGFLDTFGLGSTLSCHEDMVEVKVSEVNGDASADICNIQTRSDQTEKKLGNWMGPAIKMSLPSFSGNTKYFPNLLKYSCHLHCRVRPVRPAIVSNPLEDEDLSERNHTSQEQLENERRLSVAVMLSKPIIALQFKDLTMQVEAPVVVYPSM